MKKNLSFAYFAMVVAVSFFIIECSGGKETAFYVSPDGNDSSTGTSPRTAFLTLGRALDAVAEVTASGPLVKPVTVHVGGGVYQLDAPLVINPRHSGTAAFPVTISAKPDAPAVISGGMPVIGWKEGRNGVWTAQVEPGWLFRQLFVNGERRIRARTPNVDLFRVDGAVKRDEKASFTYRDDDIDPAWADTAAELIMLQKWAELRMHIETADPVAKAVTLSKLSSPSNRENNARYYVENVPDALDAAGEWYLDPDSGVVSYIPLPGENPAEAEIVAPALTELVRFEGDFDAGRWVENVTIKGLTLEYTDWSLPEDGYADVQAAVAIPSVITGNGCRSVAIENCVLRHHGNYGIEFARGCHDVAVRRSEIADMGAGGIRIGETSSREAESDKTHGAAVTDNHIHHIGEVYPAACGVIIFRSGQNLIAHNHIHDTYYTGISNGWSWGYAETDTKENIIEFNHVHDIGRGMLSDMGGNYNLGVQPGTIIRNNLFHDISSYGYGGWGIYTDEGSTGILIEKNVVYRTKSGGFHQHYGRENIIRNNIFAFATLGQIIRTRMEEHLSFTFERNIVYWAEGPLLGSNWSDDKYALDYNCYWNASGAPVLFTQWTFDEWKARGNDVHSVIADPRFTDPGNGDFTLAADSPALGLGFTPIDISTVGPRP